MSNIMNYFSFEKSIRAGQLEETVFLFYGPERFLIRQAVELLADHCLSPDSRGFNFLRFDARDIDASQLRDELNSLPIFSEHRVVVIENAGVFLASGKQRHHREEELIAGYLDNPNEACCLIFIMEEKPDSRKKIFKKIKSYGRVVEFPFLRQGELAHWVRSSLGQMGRRINPEALNYLTACTGNDLSVVEKELEKLVLFVPGTEEISLDMVRATISKTAGTGIFDLVDAVGEKNVSLAVNLLREMLIAGESPVYILYMLARQFRLILAVKSLKSQRIPDKQVQSRLSLHPYVLKKVLQQVKNFNERDLKEGFKFLLEADVAMKNSYAEQGYLLEMAVLKISS